MTADDALVADTSAAVPFLSAGHTAHERARSFLRGIPLKLTSHSLAETYSVLTRLPGDARVDAADAVTLIDAHFGVATLPARAQSDAHRRLASLGVTGGAVYDGLVALAAECAGLPLVTRDARALATYAALGVRVLMIPAVD